MSPDRSAFLHINHFARSSAWLHPAAVGYARYGVALLALLLVAGAAHARARGELRLLARSFVAGSGVLIAVALNQPLIHAVARPRPFQALPHVLLLVHASTDGSFPSDHATMAGATAAGLWWVQHRLGAIAGAAAVLMAATRVYVGAHYPLDAAAGLVLGAAIAFAAQVVLVHPALAALRRAEPVLRRVPGLLPTTT